MIHSDFQPGSPPFTIECRTSGALLHVTSLPSPYGIGDVGPAAFSWVDRLQEAGQTWWQALPLGPTGLGNSPYASLSSFAGSALLVIWEINSSDQRGVELGKALAQRIIPELESVQEPKLNHDGSSNSLIRLARKMKGAPVP